MAVRPEDQTSAQREYDKAISEFKKAKAEREKEQFEQAFVEAARQRQTPQKTATASASGFASQTAS